MDRNKIEWIVLTLFCLAALITAAWQSRYEFPAPDSKALLRDELIRMSER